MIKKDTRNTESSDHFNTTPGKLLASAMALAVILDTVGWLFALINTEVPVLTIK